MSNDLKNNLIKEVVQPFKDLVKASRIMWGVNASYLLEGMNYFGMLGLLAIFFNTHIKLNDVNAGQMVGILTGGITLAMLFLGAAVDLIGVRKSLMLSLLFMLIGRVLIVFSPSLGVGGMWSPDHLVAMLGILGIIIGNGMYQPACYAAVKYYNDEKTSAMAYAMLYAVMNLGGFLPAFISPIVRDEMNYGISGVFWVYIALTVVGIGVIHFVLSKKVMANAKRYDITAEEIKSEVEEPKTFKEKKDFYIKNFPLRDKRFLFFIFILIPVQTLFAHNWLTLPVYFLRAFEGVVSEKFDFFSNLNPVFIFILTPIIASFTAKKNTYLMMILGTFVMAAPAFILTLGPSLYTVMAYLIIMTIGEAMWQPRFLQWVAEIAPKGMTGIYMGIGQFPWFLTKIITSLYSGWFLMTYVPEGAKPDQMNTEFMWFIYGLIAMISPIGLLLARKWMMKGFVVKAQN